MNIKKQLIGIVIAIAMLTAGGGIANSALADEEPTEFTAGSEYGVLKALELMQDLNKLRQTERTPLTPQQIADANPGTEAWRVQADTADGKPVQELEVNWDLMKWAQIRADELASQGEITHDNMYNGVPDWYVHNYNDHNLTHSDKYVWVPQGDYRYGSRYYGPEALAYAGRAFGYNAVDMWASELQSGAQGYGHYLTEVSPLADIAGIGVAVKDGVIYTVLEIGNNYLNQGKTQTVEEALAELAPQPEPVTPVSVAETTVTVKEGQSPSLPAAVKVTYSDKTTKDVAVTWGQHDWSNQKPGTVTLSGSLEGIEPTVLKAKATITVTAKTATNATLNKAKLTVKSTNTGDITDDLKTITATVTYDNGTKAENQAVAWNALTDDQLATIRSRAGGQFVLEGTVAGRPVGLQITVSPASITSAKAKRDPFTTPVGIPLTQDDLNPVTVTWSNGDTTEEDYFWNLSDIDFSKPTAGTLELEGHKGSSVVTASIQVTDAVFDHLKSENLGTVEIPVTVDPTDKLNALKATLVYSDGSERSADVTWDAIDPADYASGTAGTSFTVNGTVTVDGRELSVAAMVEVQERVITDFRLSQLELTIESGEDPADKLAAITATVTYNTGETEIVPVNWPEVSEEIYGAREGGETIIAGSTDDVPEVQLTLHVNPAKLISVQTTLPDITVLKGAEPELPSAVNVAYSNGDRDVLPVSWNTAGTDFSKVGDHVLTGTVAGWSEPVTLTVHVVKATVVDVTAPEAVTVESGDTDDKVMQLLPATVTATMSNNTTAEVPVTWDALSADQKATLQSRKGGEFTLAGTVQGSDKTVSVTVTVNPAVSVAAGFGQDGSDSVSVTVESGTDAGKLGLPKTATVRWSNGDETDEAVSWSELSNEQQSILSDRRGGSFGVQGTVAGQAVHAVVTVNHATAQKVADTNGFEDGMVAVNTDPLSLPQLPQTAKVQWSNGDVTEERVEWNAVEVSQVAEEGASFTVNGMVRVVMGLASDPAAGSYEAEFNVAAQVAVNEVTEPLKDSVAEAGKLNPDDYTSDSWKVVAEAIKHANGVLSADGSSIADKIAARDQLTTALDQLQPKPPTDDQSVEQKPGQDSDRNDKVPSTGSAVVWIAVAVVVLLAAAGIIAVVMYRRKD